MNSANELYKKRWTLGMPSTDGTYNANYVYNEAGDGIIQITGLPINCTLEEIQGDRRFTDALTIARAAAAIPEMLFVIDPDFLESVADEITGLEHSAKTMGLRVLAKTQREVLKKIGITQ